MAVPANAAEPVLLHAAGSLRAALTEVANAFEAAIAAQGAGKVRPVRHAQGRDCGRREGGGVRLRQHGRIRRRSRKPARAAGRAVRAQPAVCAGEARARGRRPRRCSTACSMPQIKLGTSTPKPIRPATMRSRCFARPTAQARRSARTLEKKALQLTGGPNSPSAAARAQRLRHAGRRGQGRHLPHLLHQCARGAAQNPGQQIVELPEALAVGADYGLTVDGRRLAPCL